MADFRTLMWDPCGTCKIPSGEVKDQTDPKGQATLSYGYNAAGMRTSAVESGVTLTWGYDLAYRLTSEQRQLGPAILYRDTFTYDAVGNRTVLENAAGRTTFTYDGANQLQTSQVGATVTTYTYDNNGNLTVENAAGTRTTHTWNDENRLVQVQRTGMTTNQYTFNGDGQRVQIVDSQGTKKPIWDLENILLETDVAGATQVVYTLEPAGFGNLVSQRRGATTSFYLFDALGSTRKLTSSAGSPTDSYDYRAYGETYAASGSTTNVFRWVGTLGYYYDLDRLAYYLRARTYNPQLARFLSRDPIGFSGGDYNLYRYAISNPIAHMDPGGQIAGLSLLFCVCSQAPWKTKCDPNSLCGGWFAPPLSPPPKNEPGPNTPCNYGNLSISVPGVGSWSLQCVCLCAGDSPGVNCVRGCIQCTRNNGAPLSPLTELWCKQKCKLTHNEQKRIDCCVNTQAAQGGCLKPWFVPGQPPKEYRGGCDRIKVP